MAKITKEAALLYHSQGKPGKIEVVPTKPYSTQTDLSLAYSPGVAEPCLEIEKNPQDAYKYTAKGNLVAVISNGTAVLGLGDIGAMAGKPVMEGKGLLFKAFRSLDVFQIDTPESRGNRLDGLDELFRILFVHFDVENIDSTVYFEQKSFPFHDRCPCHGTDISKAQYGRTIRDNCHQVTLGSIFISILWILFDFKTGFGYAWRIGE